MTFDFTKKEFSIGSGVPTFQFYRKGFNFGGGSPSYSDIVLSGVGALTLSNSLANGINYVKLFGGCEQRNVPEGYTEVEYLESDGTQYIETNLILNSVATVEMVAKLNTTASISPCALWGFMGNQGSGATYPRWQCSAYSTKWLMDLNATTAGYPLVDTNIHTLKNECFYNSNNVLVYQSVIDGVEQFATAQEVAVAELYIENTLKVYLFARNNNGTVGNFVEGRIYQFKAIQDGVLACKLIPCKRNSDNVLGMYDTVTGTFLTNAGTGTFTAGSALTTPTPDRPIDIVCNNGVVKWDSTNQEIYADGTVETVEVIGKNLLDINSSGIVAGYLASDGSLVQSTSWSVSDYIPIKANTTFIYSTTRPSGGLGSGAYLAYYDANRAIISTQNQGSNANKTFTTPAGTAYIKVSFFSSGNWQVELGSTATEYEEYFDGGSATAEMLLKVGDYQDEQSVLDGAVTRKVGVKVLDGTENWFGGRYFVLDLSDMFARSFNPGFCTHFAIRPYDGAGDIQLGSNSTYTYWFEFSNKPSGVTDIASWEQWLADQYNAGEPVIVVYPLATATTESVTAQPLTIQEGTNIVEITEASIDNLELEVSYKATA